MNNHPFYVVDSAGIAAAVRRTETRATDFGWNQQLLRWSGIRQLCHRYRHARPFARHAMWLVVQAQDRTSCDEERGPRSSTRNPARNPPLNLSSKLAALRMPE